MTNMFRYGRAMKTMIRTVVSLDPLGQMQCVQCRMYSHVTRELVPSVRTAIRCPFTTLTSNQKSLHPASAYAVITDDNDIDNSYHKIVYSIPKSVSVPLKSPHNNCSSFNFGCHHHTGFFQTREFHSKRVTSDAERTVNFHIRSFQTSGPDYANSESNVEKSVKVLKDLANNKVRLVPAEVYFRKKGIVAEPRKSLGTRIVDELKHYYHGFRLLWIDMKISLRLIWLLMKGESLSRRERKQLVRTSSDLFRLVPFMVFLIVPFMEFLLPFALKLFPSMLPSTFQDKEKQAEKTRKRLKVKLEMAKFLQETIQDSTLSSTNKEKSQNLVQEFASFVTTIRSAGGMASKDEILRYSKLFEDELTLDQLPRPQLSALCKLLDIQTMGTDNFIRFQLRMKMRQLMNDDKMIVMEGINTLTASELQAACRERGMRALGMTEDRLKGQLQQWLDLHLKEDVPTTLLLLTRSMYLPDEVPVEDQLKVIISTLPEATAEEAKIKIAEVTGDKVANKAKLERILQEEEAIKKEKEEEKEEAAAEQAPSPIKVDVLDADLAKEIPMEEALRDMAPVIEAKPSEALEEEVEQISGKDLKDLESAIETLAEEKNFDIDREELNNLKEDVEDYHEDLKNLKDIVVASGDMGVEQSVGAKRLSSKLDKMINQMDVIMDDLHKEKESLMEDIELKEVRMKRSSSLQEDNELREAVLDEIKATKSNVISINELVLSMRRIQKISDEDRFQKVCEVLDEDKDGIINVEDVLRVIEELGAENIKLTNKQVNNLVKTLRDETVLEDIEKQKLREEKEFMEQLDKADEERVKLEEEEQKKQKDSLEL
ncbi:mitochondrial proton/calcium exchanger protein-like [Lineus longissimus]|uniref:mitochondrial proton/calcium exchanger protein-like n=1 Tax=Lineus longissimus TaxID=88925 RepID=UPI002B4E1157